MAQHKKTTAKKSTKKSPKSNQTLAWIRSRQRWHLILAALVIVAIGALGTWKLTTSNAAGELGYEACYVRGRWYTFPDSQCRPTCLTGAGAWIKHPDHYGYCSKAVSPDMSKTKCNSLDRQFVGDIGCARRWQQTNARNALQCIDNTDTYRVDDPYDYCGGGLSLNWVWPVASTRHLGATPWGEYNARGQHKGIDIGNFDGSSLNKPVRAAHAGRVTQSYDGGQYGWFIVIKATDTPYWYAYQHLAKTDIQVKVGQVVGAGQQVGKIGIYGKGDNNTFYHVHFSVEKGNWISYYSSPLSQSINPLRVLPD